MEKKLFSHTLSNGLVVSGNAAKQCLYFDSVDHANCYADVGFSHLKGLSSMNTDTVEESKMCFTVVEILL